MKYYHVFFVMLRLLVVLQVILVLLKKQLLSPDLKTIIDSILKLSIGLFVIIFFYFHNVGMDPWDIYVLQFSGIVIITDIDYKNLLKIIGNVSPTLSKHLSPLKDIQRYPSNN